MVFQVIGQNHGADSLGNEIYVIGDRADWPERDMLSHAQISSPQQTRVTDDYTLSDALAREADADYVMEPQDPDGKWAAVYGPSCCNGASKHEFLDPYNPWYRFDREAVPIEHENVADPRIASDGKRAILAYSRPLYEAPHAGSPRVIFRLYGDPPPPVRRRSARS